MALVVKNLSAKAGNAGSTPGSVRSPEEETATHSRILAWRIPWTEEPGGLQSPGRDPAAGAGLPEQPALTHSRGTGWAGGGFYPRPFTAVPRYLGTRLNSPGDPKDPPFTAARLCLPIASAWPPNSLSGFLAVSHQTPSSTCYGAFAQAVSPSCSTDKSLPFR